MNRKFNSNYVSILHGKPDGTKALFNLLKLINLT